jgi:iron complex transport system substrate-binding protein
VSLAPSLTEIVCALGADSCLVGRTSACNYPPDAVWKVPVLADFGIPAIEPIIAARPDLVLHVDLENKSDSARMTSLGIRSVRIPCEQLDDIPAAIEAVGSLIGRNKEALAMADSIRTEFERRRNLRRGRRSRVYVEIWNDPITTVGRDSFISQAISLAGGENVGDESGAGYYQVSPEWVLDRNPDTILCFHSAGLCAKLLARRTGWGEIAAMKSGRVFDSLNPDCIMRPGPRIVDGLVELETALNTGTEQ